MERIGAIMLMGTIISIFASCNLFKEKTYNDFETGKEFFWNRDSFCLKLPKQYFIYADYSEGAMLFRLTDEECGMPFNDILNLGFSKIYKYATGHYILGYFTEDHLILCEELESNEKIYLSFNFNTQEIDNNLDEKKVFETFNFTAKDWLKLCNTRK